MRAPFAFTLWRRPGKMEFDVAMRFTKLLGAHGPSGVARIIIWKLYRDQLLASGIPAALMLTGMLFGFVDQQSRHDGAQAVIQVIGCWGILQFAISACLAIYSFCGCQFWLSAFEHGIRTGRIQEFVLPSVK